MAINQEKLLQKKEEIIKNNLEKISDEKFILNLFNENIKKIIPEAKTVKEIKIEIIKFNQVVKGREQLTVKYFLEFFDKKNILCKKTIIGKAHRTGDREKTFWIREYTWKQYFCHEKKHTVAKPLFYSFPLGLILYDWTDGQNLTYYLEKKSGLETKKNLVANAAFCLKKLHSIKPNHSIIEKLEKIQNKKKTISNKKAGTTKFEEIFKKDKAMFSQIQLIIKKFDAIRTKNGNKLQSIIIHGDYQPNHVLLSGDNFVIIDWDNSRLDNPLVDLASFIFYLSNVKNVSIIENAALAQHFIENYFGKKITSAEQEKIDLYQIPFILNNINYYSYHKNFKAVKKNLEKITKYIL